MVYFIFFWLIVIICVFIVLLFLRCLLHYFLSLALFYFMVACVFIFSLLSPFNYSVWGLCLICFQILSFGICCRALVSCGSGHPFRRRLLCTKSLVFSYLYLFICHLFLLFYSRLVIIFDDLLDFLTLIFRLFRCLLVDCHFLRVYYYLSQLRYFALLYAWFIIIIFFNLYLRFLFTGHACYYWSPYISSACNSVIIDDRLIVSGITLWSVFLVNPRSLVHDMIIVFRSQHYPFSWHHHSLYLLVRCLILRMRAFSLWLLYYINRFFEFICDILILSVLYLRALFYLFFLCALCALYVLFSTLTCIVLRMFSYFAIYTSATILSFIQHMLLWPLVLFCMRFIIILLRFH